MLRLMRCGSGFGGRKWVLEKMPEGKLKFDGKEIALGSGIITCGRASDNIIAFPGDSNVSRYHAEVEERDGEYFLIDLGSSNGTTLNGKKVDREMPLQDGDTILLGGSSRLEINFDRGSEKDADDANQPEKESDFSMGEFGGGSRMPNIPTGSPGAGGALSSGLGSGGGSAAGTVGGAAAVAGGAASAAPAGSNATIMVAGVVGGLALVCVVAAAAIYLTSGSGCHARAVISKPETGETISQPVDIEVESQDTECVAQAVFTLDGNEVARTDEQPFTAKLDPKEFPELSDGFEHNLQIVLIDENGEKIPQPESVQLAFETRQVNKPPPTPEIVQDSTQKQAPGKKGSTASLVDIQAMSSQLVKRFPASANYNVSNPQFLQAVQKATADYAKDGYYQRAEAYRDVINVAYVQQNLDAGLGFTLAISRSNLNPAKQGTDEGLWHMSSDFVATNGYNGPCGTETLSDPSQKCAAIASAAYMKALFNVFDDDVIYTVAAFGKSTADASAWKANLPANKADIWNSIKTQQERDQVVRFIAAGIVVENPQKFGLTKDRPLSELYRVTQ